MKSSDTQINPCEELCLLAEDWDYEGVKELIDTYGVRGAEPQAGKTGEIFLYDIEQALIKIPPRKHDNAIPLIQLLLYYKPSKCKITMVLKGAVSKSQFRTVRLLLEHGADPNHLEEAAAVGDFDTIETLIASGAEIRLATRAIELAAENGHTKTLQSLIDLDFPFRKETVAVSALLSNTPATIDAARKAGVVFTAAHLDNEDIFDCPKSLEYLVRLGLPAPSKIAAP